MKENNFYYQLRMKAALTLTQLSQLLDINAEALHLIEIGTVKPDDAIIGKLADILHCTVDLLKLSAINPDEIEDEATREDFKTLLPTVPGVAFRVVDVELLRKAYNEKFPVTSNPPGEGDRNN